MAKTKKVERHAPKATSYSRWNVYATCPAKFAYKHIEKLPDPQGPAAARGEQIHLLAEQFAQRQLKKLPPELGLYRKELEEHRSLIKLGAAWTERMWVLDEHWEPMKDPWSPDIYLRIKTDYVASLPGRVIKIVDYKTGRVQDRGYEPQLELYAAGAVAMFEDVEKIITQLYFLDHYVSPQREYTAKEAKRFQAKWDERFKRVANDTTFTPRPGDHCRYCPYAKSKGGPCKFS